MKRIVILQWLAVLAIGVGIGYAAGLGQWINAMTTGETETSNTTGTNAAAPCCSQHAACAEGECSEAASTAVSIPGAEGALPSCCSQGVSRTKMMAAASESKPADDATTAETTAAAPSEESQP